MAGDGTPQPRSHRDGVRQTLPLSVAVFGFGISFGVLARASGMGTLAPVVMSATTFAGSSQFAAISVLGAGGGVAAAVAAAVLLNARYAPIGVSVAPYLTGPWWSRFLHGQLIVDESWAIAAEGEGRFNTKVLVGAGLTVYVAWLVGTVVGVAFGDLIGDPSRLGLDAAFPALFLALLVPQVTSKAARQAAVLGAAIALVLTPFTPAGVPIVAASIACLLGLRSAPTEPIRDDPPENPPENPEEIA
jgi:4-azaleucine resistance transporter AzlC